MGDSHICKGTNWETLLLLPDIIFCLLSSVLEEQVSCLYRKKSLIQKKASILITLTLISRKIWYSNDDSNCLQSSQYLQSIAWEWIQQCITVHVFYHLQYYLMLIKYFLELKCMVLDKLKAQLFKRIETTEVAFYEGRKFNFLIRRTKHV